MLFLEFAVWGAYLITMGTFLGKNGLGNHIGIFYAVQGIVSIFMPALIGAVADRWIPAQKMLSICHFIAGGFMVGAAVYGLTTAELDFWPLFSLYIVSVAFYMPTIGLSNSVSYCVLQAADKDPVKHFPPIRTLGTIGFICAMLVNNFVDFQESATQFLFSGILSFSLAIYSLSLPNCPCATSKQKTSLAEILGLKAFKLFKNKQMAIFFLFSMMLGVSLQITNGFADPYIHSFLYIDKFNDLWVAQNSTALISLSQVSETLCILLIPFFLRRFGIKIVMLLAMSAWVLRFGFLGLGSPAMPGLILFILSMIIYGIAFDFFNVSGSLYVNQKTDSSMRSAAQGLFMVMTNGLGATAGVLSAQAVVSHFVGPYQDMTGMPTDQAAFLDGWHTCWLIFAAYALFVAVAFFFCFKDPRKADKNLNRSKIDAAEGLGAENPAGDADISITH